MDDNPCVSLRVPAVLQAGLLVVACQALLQGHLAAVPPWEAPDEPWHLAYAEALAGGRPPSPSDTYEYHHPPGGYLWPALALRALGWSAVPRAAYEPRFPLAANAYRHPADDPGAPLLRLLRAWNGLLSAPAIALAWAAARRLRRRRRGPPPLLAAGLCLLFPAAAFAAATLTNDTAALLAGAALWYLTARTLVPVTSEVRSGAGPSAALRDGLLLGGVAALAAAVKLNVLPLLILPVAAVTLRPGTAAAPAVIRRLARAGGAFLVALVTTALALVALAGIPLLAALGRLPDQLRHRSAGGDLLHAELPAQLLRLVDSGMGFYGWMNVTLDPRLRWSALGLLVLCLGLALLPEAAAPSDGTAARSNVAAGDPKARFLAMVAVAVLVLATLANAALDPAALQGRLLLPAAPAAAWLAAAGITRLPRRLMPVLPGLLLALQVIATTRWLPAAYDGPIVEGVLLQRGTEKPVAPSLRLSGGDGRDTLLAVTAPMDLRRLELGVIVGHGSGSLRLELWRAPDGIDGQAVLLGRAEAPLSTLGRPAIDAPSHVGPLADTSWLGVDLSPPASILPAGARLLARIEVLPYDDPPDSGSDPVIPPAPETTFGAADEAWLWTGDPLESPLLLPESGADEGPDVAWIAYGATTKKAPR